MQSDRLLGPELTDVDGNAEDRRGTVSVFNGPVSLVRTAASADAEVQAVAAWITECAQQGVRAGEIAVFMRSNAELERGRRAVSITGLAHHVLDELVDTDTDDKVPVAGGRLRVKRHDLNELLITHPQATFFWRVAGKSMVEAGIHDGDILVVNRALTAGHRDIVVPQVDGDFTVKYLHKRNGRIKLVAANPTFPDITFKDGQVMVVVAVVTCTIKRFVS